MAASRVLTLAPEYLSAMAVKLLASPALSTDSQLVIATSRPVARSLLRRSLASGRARVGVRATTLPELAREMAAPRSERRVLPPQTDRLIVAHLLAGDPGPYGPAARRPAVVAAVARALRELREAGMFFLPTEVLPTSIGRRRWERLEHLSRLLEALDRHLEQHALADDAQVYRAAVGGPIPGRASEALMVGVYDLTGVQKELVADLAARVSLTWLCPLPEEESPSREAIEQTLAWAESRGLAIEAVAIEPPSATPVRVLACPGQRAEAREVARGVLAAAEAGVAFGEMAVLLATSASQGPVFREEFCRAGIPLVGDGKRRLGETPGGRVVAAVAATLAGEAGESEVATIVGALAAAEDLMPSYRALAVLRAAGVRRLEQVPDRLGRLAEQYTGDTAALEALVRLVGRWLKAAAHLERGLQQAFVAASWPSAAHALVVFVEALGWPEGLRSELRRAASELAALESLGVAPRPEMVIDVWRQRCEDLEVDAPPGAEQRGLGEGVLLVEWNRARGLTAEAVWLTGLAHETFLPAGEEDPVLDEQTRRCLSQEAGSPLPMVRERYLEQDLLFRLGMAVADRVTLSWARTDDEQGNILFPAEPLARLIEARSGELLDARDPASNPIVHRVPADLPGFDDSRRPLLDEAEFDLALARTEGGRRVLERDAALARRLRADRRRFRDSQLSEYLGMIGTAAPTPEHVSPSDLEELATCPFRFFLRAVLGIRPPAEPPALAPAARDLGSLAHRVLEDFFRPQGKERPDEPWPQRLRRWIRIRLREVQGQVPKESGPLWRASARRLERELLGFLLDELEALGQRKVRVAGIEEEYVGELNLGSAVVRVRGRPDRIDEDAAGEVEIVDYKWSKGRHYPKSEGALFVGGRCLQLPLYAWLVLQDGDIARVKRVRYAFLRGARRSFAVERRTLEARQQEMVTLVDKVLDFARRGELPPVPGGGENCRHCDYRIVCGPGIVRIAQRVADDPICQRHRALAAEHP